MFFSGNKKKIDETNKLTDKYRGCIIGGAVGDALGYTVEFMSEQEIHRQFGERGISEYRTVNGRALISDDTQMTLFTATGLLNKHPPLPCSNKLTPYITEIGNNYKDWYLTQTEKYPINTNKRNSWLINVPELFFPRAPGNTCMSALEMRINNIVASISRPVNASKGCGGVMRVAPIGLYFDGKSIDINDIDMLAAEAAAITHSHDLGYIPAAGLAHIIHLVTHRGFKLLNAIVDMIIKMKELFAKSRYIDTFTQLIEKAVLLADSAYSDIDAIHKLGSGWVGEEALAIAIFCALRYQNNFESAIIAAVNHEGDSDSTGAITGNILGAYLGMSAIPDKYLNKLELYDVMTEIADDLLNKNVENDPNYVSKYVDKTYCPTVKS